MAVRRNIIGITGYARHGKDTLAELMIERLGPSCVKLALADTMREMAVAIDPVVSLRYEFRLARYVTYNQLVERVGYDEAKKYPEVRRFLQRLGTEAGRNVLGEDFWVEQTARRIAALPASVETVLITDVRFPNEAHWCHAYGEVWAVARVNSDGTPFKNGVGTAHPSEAHIEALRKGADRLFVASSLVGLGNELERELAYIRKHNAGQFAIGNRWLEDVNGVPV